MFKKNKEKKQVDRDRLLEKYYQENKEYNFTPGQREFLERRINEQKFGVFGNALITIITIAVIVAIFYLMV